MRQPSSLAPARLRDTAPRKHPCAWLRRSSTADLCFCIGLKRHLLLLRRGPIKSLNGRQCTELGTTVRRHAVMYWSQSSGFINRIRLARECIVIELTRSAIFAKPLRKHVRVSVLRDTNISAIPPVMTAMAFSCKCAHSSKNSSSGRVRDGGVRVGKIRYRIKGCRMCLL